MMFGICFKIKQESEKQEGMWGGQDWLMGNDGGSSFCSEYPKFSVIRRK